jgi:hypothetical protein
MSEPKIIEKKSWNKNLKSANKAKSDEFYTQLSYIEKELKHYKEHLRGRVIFCNCDDPEESHFWKYFSENFEFLWLKKLISTHYEDTKPSYKLEIIADINHDGRINKLDTVRTPLKQNWDFRSPECIEILKEADIIVTNPPFSLFRDYVEQLQEYDKKFVILGNSNAITYKEIFRLIKENKIWLGKSIHSGDVEFRVPAHYEIRSKSFRIGEDGNSYIKVPSIRWFTNLDYKERHEDLILYKEYSPEEYPKYDNYDAINLDITKNIPLDYIGAMGVPITFMDKYSPDQFEIIALGIVGSIDFTCNKRMEILDKDGIPTGKSTFNAKGTLYRPYNPIKDSSPAFKNSETWELYSSIYARIIIRNKKL